MKILNFVGNRWIEKKTSQKYNLYKSICHLFGVFNKFRKFSFLVFVSKLLISNNPLDYNISIFIAKFTSYLKLPYFKKYFTFLKCANFLSNKNYPLYIENRLPQVYIFDNTKKNLLICFTGHENKLNLPIPIFHSLVKDHFNAVAYFFCRGKDFYSSDLELVNQAVNSLISLNIWKEVNILGTSAGGIPVLMLPKKEIIKKKVSFSPPIKRSPNLIKNIENCSYDNFLNTKIFFDIGSHSDKKHYSFLKEILPKRIFESFIEDLSKYNFKSHGTLITLLRKQRLNDLFVWLAN